MCQTGQYLVYTTLQGILWIFIVKKSWYDCTIHFSVLSNLHQSLSSDMTLVKSKSASHNYQMIYHDALSPVFPGEENVLLIIIWGWREKKNLDDCKPTDFVLTPAGLR